MSDDLSSRTIINRYLDERIDGLTELLVKVRGMVESERALPTRRPSERFKRLTIRECELTGFITALRRGRTRPS